MQCPSCSTTNAADAKKCASCGTFLGPTLSMDKPSDDEVPTNLVLAILSAALPLLCATGGGFALLALPVGLYAVKQALSVEAHLKARDVPASQVASINARKYAVVGIVLAFVLSIGHFVYNAVAAAEEVKQDVVREVPAEAEL